MKKSFNLIIFLILLFCPIIINASTLNTNIVAIGTSIGKTTEDIEIKDFKYYHNNIDEFGVVGTIKNNVPLKTKYEIIINYYDIYGNNIYTQKVEEEIKADSKKEIIIKNNITEVAEIYNIYQISKYSININSTSEELKDIDYTINKYNIDIKVKNDNTYNITETITVNYLNDNKPFIKKIPINNRKDMYNKTYISNLQIDKEYSFRKTKDNYIIAIDGLAKKDTQKTYKITYEYKYGKDTNKEYDELYYILNGISDDTIISNLSFNIEMPYEVEQNLIEMALINKKIETTSNIVYTVNNKVITGQYLEKIYPNEKLVIKAKLNDNYFAKAKEHNIFNILIMIIIPTVSVAIAFILWYIFGKDNKFVKRKISTIPDNLNSLEIGYLYKGKTSNLDIASLIVHLANKGYLSIEEDESDFALIKSFELHKVKDYTGKNNKERIIFENLFKEKEIITPEDLDENFYNAVSNVIEDLNDTENQGRIFENTTNQTFITVLLTVISLFTIIYIPSIEYGTIDDSVVSIFMISLYFLIFGAIYSLINKKIFKMLISIILGLYIIYYVTSIPLSYALTNDIGYLLSFIYGILCIILLIIFIRIMPKRTMYGNKMLGKINGLKYYFENITKKEIEGKIKDNPNYFYDMLPYTFVLGISNVWIKKFENIKMSKPEWTSIKTFHFASFSTFVTHMIHTLEKNIRNNYK